MIWMSFIHNFFDVNRATVYFGYGLVFFILGLAVALQSRAASRLDLARSLNWLAAFGFAHGFHEWGDLFIPIQTAYLPVPVVQLLYRLHVLLLALSFAFLFEFGVALLRPLGRASWLYSIPGGLLAVWIFVTYFPLAAWLQDFTAWDNAANALARYFLGFPAGLVAAYGLRQHTYQRIAPLNVPNIVSMLRFAGWLLVVYAALAGLVVPPINFFPGNWLNTNTFEAIFILPIPVYRSLIGLGLTIAIIRGLEIFDVETERIIEHMEQTQILFSERERLGRELHDGAIQKVYTAGLLVESAHKLVEPDHPVLIERLDKAMTVLDDAIRDLRRSLGELREAPGETPLAVSLQDLSEDPRFHPLVDISLELSLPEGETLSPARTEHVLAIVNEALSNVVRHAHARQVKIRASHKEGRLLLTVEDDGVSLPKSYTAGYGLRNMRDRARLLEGQLEVQALDGKGTRVVLSMPWRDQR